MAEMTWQSMGLNSAVAREVRTHARVSRAAIDDHTFSFTDLKALWLSEDGEHIVLTHHRDTVWQYWRNCPEGWRLISVHRGRKQAQNQAVSRHEAVLESGTYVYAQASPQHRELTVHCRSTEGPELIRRIFSSLGYATRTEDVRV